MSCCFYKYSISLTFRREKGKRKRRKIEDNRYSTIFLCMQDESKDTLNNSVSLETGGNVKLDISQFFGKTMMVE